MVSTMIAAAPSHLPVLQAGVVALQREDHVIEQLHPQDLPGGGEPLGDLPVLGARLDVAGGMVVGHYHRRSPVLQGIGKDLAGVDDSAVSKVFYIDF